MLKFSAFINAIHTAILTANDALMTKNIELLQKYFEDAQEREEFESSVDNALTSVNSVLNQSNQRISRQQLTEMLSSLEQVRDNMSQAEEGGINPDSGRVPDSLRPRMTTIQFPEQTANGVEMRDVQVPLITLVPLSMTEVSEVKFRTDLEIQDENNELLVSFSPTKSAQSSNTENTAVASIEITLKPRESTEGLRKIVEGYEKMLRSQLPS